MAHYVGGIVTQCAWLLPSGYRVFRTRWGVWCRPPEFRSQWHLMRFDPCVDGKEADDF